MARPIENSLSELSLVILSRGPFENLKLHQLLAVLFVLLSACEYEIVVDFCERPTVYTGVAGPVPPLGQDSVSFEKNGHVTKKYSSI